MVECLVLPIIWKFRDKWKVIFLNTVKRIFHIIWSASHQNKEERKSFQKMYHISRFHYCFYVILLVENCFFSEKSNVPGIARNPYHDLKEFIKFNNSLGHEYENRPPPPQLTRAERIRLSIMSIERRPDWRGLYWMEWTLEVTAQNTHSSTIHV
jgi:hypothetical protein